MNLEEDKKNALKEKMREIYNGNKKTMITKNSSDVRSNQTDPYQKMRKVLGNLENRHLVNKKKKKQTRIFNSRNKFYEVIGNDLKKDAYLKLSEKNKLDFSIMIENLNLKKNEIMQNCNSNEIEEETVDICEKQLDNLIAYSSYLNADFTIDVIAPIISYFEKAVVQTKNYYFYVEIADLYMHIGYYQNAIEYLKLYLENNENTPPIASKINYCKRKISSEKIEFCKKNNIPYILVDTMEYEKETEFVNNKYCSDYYDKKEYNVDCVVRIEKTKRLDRYLERHK